MREFKVNNWLGLTKEGEYITIDQVKDIHTDYYCPACGEVLHGRALESELVERHFYHLQNNNLESCNCEQAYKRYWKDKFISVGEIMTLPFLNEITCIAKEIDYKVNSDLIADIYIKSSNDDDILILFEDNKQVENSNLNYTIFYLNFMELKRDLTNINECLVLLHSEQINKMNIEFKNKINDIASVFTRFLKIDFSECAVNINKCVSIKKEFELLGYKDECIIMDCLIDSLKKRTTAICKYKNINITKDEVKAVEFLINKLRAITKYNISLDVKMLKSMKYKIYNKGYYNNSWSKSVYFDLIKPIGLEFNSYINKIENILSNYE